MDEVIVRDLLALKNDSWLEEDETALNAGQLLNALRFISVNFDEEGNIELDYNDGDLFWGHNVMVAISAEHEVKEASIAG